MRFLLPFLDQYPPKWCRLVARKNRGRDMMSTRDLARVSGLPRSTVDKVSKQDSWKSVGAATIQRFSLACGVNFMDGNNLKHNREFFRKRRWVHLTRADQQQQAMFWRLFDDLSGRVLSGSAAAPTP